jgi:hypothetical protein
VIARVLPNPKGSDARREQIVIRNAGQTTVDLAGWEIFVAKDRRLGLEGQLDPGQERTFTIGSRPLFVNSADILFLVNDKDELVDRARYERKQVEADEWITF